MLATSAAAAAVTLAIKADTTGETDIPASQPMASPTSTRAKNAGEKVRGTCLALIMHLRFKGNSAFKVADRGQRDGITDRSLLPVGETGGVPDLDLVVLQAAIEQR